MNFRGMRIVLPAVSTSRLSSGPELLSVLPEDHPQRPAILQLFRAHAQGLATVQDGSGLWHQMLDRPDTFLEESCTAM